jgi:hypothetical protein
VAEVHVGRQFPVGTEVRLFRRVGDWWTGSTGDPVQTATADEHGSVTFDGLEDAAPFWAVSDAVKPVKALRVTAKVFTPAAKAARDTPARELASQSHAPPTGRTKTGARDTATLRRPSAEQEAANEAKVAAQPTAPVEPKPEKPAARSAPKRSSGRKPAAKSKKQGGK